MPMIQETLDYLNQLKRHTEGRQAILLRLSALEKQFHESHYRQQMAKACKGLTQTYEGRYFLLPNKDGLLILKDAPSESIDTSIHSLRMLMKDSQVIQGLDPIQGQSDLFTVWYDLADDYALFLSEMKGLIAGKLLLPSAIETLAEQTKRKPLKPTAQPETKSMSSGLKMVPVQAPSARAKDTPLDPERLHQLVQTIQVTDLEGLMQKQKVYASLPGKKAVTVMINHTVNFTQAIQRLMPSLEATPDRFLSRYLMAKLESQLLKNKPNLSNEKGIISSLTLSLDVLQSDMFKEFSQHVRSLQKSKLVLEFDLSDAIQNPDMFRQAMKTLHTDGYRTCLAGITPQAIDWLNLSQFDVEFYKIQLTEADEVTLDDEALIARLTWALNSIDKVKVILAGCDSQKAISFGRTCGLTLMQGTALP
ncbi:EAL domain-containing protein [Temperatibacter marinus]|uniref:EAL domain-containing protein n=1 Tax=Temperatibacter marinus TaxID=1456591 RepID=A0AA52EKX6_9PROT|nr:EAL domain-containing protein [Temperatibacter marinus]WND04139.1 EAL domain-containing protein [Temperatibacter marinus]